MKLQIKDFLCFSLYSTSRAMTQLYHYYLKDLDLTYPQFLVLIALWNKDGQKVGEIGEELHLDNGTLTPLLKLLERKNLLTRKRSVSDERVVEIWLTKEARKKEEQINRMAQSMLKDLSMSEKDVIKMSAQIAKIRSKIELAIQKKTQR